ncbi:MAG: asparaginase [Gammaproteobacteria bacterium]|nr:asparaginase [Gammaproteobacteria bacterium]
MPKVTKSVYVLSTGGTIGMQKTAEGYAPAPGYLAKAMAKIPELKNADMPRYDLFEYETPIDSANMTPDHWMQIGDHILKNYDAYDGFVILHGTDTMAYTASALSFMLENLGKPVILTGSQLPLFETRNDARENLINAMMIAGHFRIPEVCVYFNNKLFRGNRCKKVDASSFSAFASPNFPTLGKVGTEVMVRQQILRSQPAAKLHLQLIDSVAIGVLRIFPGMSLDMLRHFLRPPLQALVLESYGLGNAPEDRPFLDIIRRSVSEGMVIVNCSQCLTAKVRMRVYAAGAALLEAGVVPGGDMTTEAAIAKLFYLFSKQLTLPEIKSELRIDLRGELTI